MGGSSSAVAYDYEGQLKADTKLQTMEIGEESKGATRPRRRAGYPDLIRQVVSGLAASDWPQVSLP